MDDRLKQAVFDATHNPHQFVCSPREFVERYGPVPEDALEQVEKHIVLCKDGMIRPRWSRFHRGYRDR